MLILLVIIPLFGTVLWRYSLQEFKQVSIEEKRIQAYYLAMSGALLIADNQTLGEGTYIIEFEGNEITVEMRYINGSNSKEIISTIEVNHNIVETLQLTILNGKRDWKRL